MVDEAVAHHELQGPPVGSVATSREMEARGRLCDPRRGAGRVMPRSELIEVDVVRLCWE